MTLDIPVYAHILITRPHFNEYFTKVVVADELNSSFKHYQKLNRFDELFSKLLGQVFASDENGLNIPTFICTIWYA